MKSFLVTFASQYDRHLEIAPASPDLFNVPKRKVKVSYSVVFISLKEEILKSLNITKEGTLSFGVRKMAPLITIVCFVLLVMETLVGMVANGSIVLINFINCFRSGKLSPTDLILICLGLSRLLQQAVVILEVTLFALLNSTLSNVLFTMIIVWIFTNTVNLWFAASLSVFYLAKIAIFSHPVFLQVKQRLPELVPWLLLGSVVLSAVVTIIIITSWQYGFSACTHYKPLSINESNAEMNMQDVCRHLTTLVAVFDFIPFMAFLSSSIFLITSLWKHMRRVQCNGTGTMDLNTEAHLSAIKALASFAVLYLISFAADTLQFIPVWDNQDSWTTVFTNVSAVYPSGHAIILILINPKLKQAWVRMIHHLKCHLGKVEPS